MYKNLDNLKENNLDDTGCLLSVVKDIDNNRILAVFENKTVELGVKPSSEGLELMSYVEIYNTKSAGMNTDIELTDIDIYTSGVTLYFTNGKKIYLQVIYGDENNIEDSFAEDNYHIEYHSDFSVLNMLIADDKYCIYKTALIGMVEVTVVNKDMNSYASFFLIYRTVFTGLVEVTVVDKDMNSYASFFPTENTDIKDVVATAVKNKKYDKDSIKNVSNKEELVKNLSESIDGIASILNCFCYNF